MARRASRAKTSKPTSAPMAAVSGATRTRAKPVETVLRLPLPANWRTSTWQVPPMLAKIRPEDYERTAREFEADARGKVSDDWREAWKVWCRRILVDSVRKETLPTARMGLFD